MIEKLGLPIQPILFAFGATVVTSVALYYFIFSRKRRMHKTLYGKQSIEREDGTRQSPYIPTDGKGYQTTFFDDVQTLYDGFQKGCSISGDKPYLGTLNLTTEQYEWQTYNEIYSMAQKFGSALAAKGLARQAEGFLGIFSKNRYEWIVAEQACNMFSYIVVPLYDTLGHEAVHYIINQTEMRIMICDDEAKVKTAIDHKKVLPTLQIVINLSETNDNLKQLGEQVGLTIVSFQEMLEIGENNLRDPDPPKTDDLATICYTSGTTGVPKGVMISHEALIADISALFLFWKATDTTMQSDDVTISYLPLAHVYERLVDATITQLGASIGFGRGDVKKLMDDMQILKPTFFPAVPRLLNRLYDKVMNGVRNSWIKRMLFNLALNRKVAQINRGTTNRDTIWDTLVFSKIHQLLGGRVKFISTGSAPISKEVYEFSRAALGATLVEGYGQTECVAAVTLSFPCDPNLGHVGAILPCCVVKLDDVPDMEYYAADGKGEVCVKGPVVMQGYYKNKVQTEETIDSDGWVHTGDVGMWLPNGALKIIDRKKHIFKLAQGEYIAPEKVEGIYTRSKFVAQVFLDGSSLENCALAIVVPDEEVLPDWAAKKGIDGDFKALCANEEVKKAILEDITSQGKEAGLKSFEQAKDIHVHAEPLSVENGLLTPTFKSKRPALRIHFQKQFDDMYAAMKQTA